MGNAADMQTLITALAYQYVLNGEVTHAMIPDTPEVESERRQIFFCAAVNLPFCYVKTDTRNRFLKQIVSRISHVRKSRRYPGHTRIRVKDYKQALVSTLKKDGSALIEDLRLHAVLADLQGRMQSPDTRSACGRLVNGILDSRKKQDPMACPGDVFNRDAEHYYQETLRKQHMAEGFKILISEFSGMNLWAGFREPVFRDIIHTILPDTDMDHFLKQVKHPLMAHDLPAEQIKKLLFLIILYVNMEAGHAAPRQEA
jgi:hypothetical protein